MSDQSENSPAEEDMAEEEGGGQLLEGQNLQEDDEKKMTTSLPSSAAEASVARNSPRSVPTTSEDMMQEEEGGQLLEGQNLQEDDEKKVTTSLPSSAAEASMARNSPRSVPTTSEDMAQEEGRGQQLEGQNLQEEDNERKVATPLPSSSGEASSARNSPRSPPATSEDMALEEGGEQRVEAQNLQGEDDEEKNASPLTASAGEAPMARNSLTTPPTGSTLSGSSPSLNFKIHYGKRGMENRCKGSSTEGFKIPRYHEENRDDVAVSSHPGSQTAGDCRHEEELLGVGKDQNPAYNPFIERVFRDTDTKIGLLKGIADYHQRNGIYPSDDSIAFDDFVVNWLQVNITEEQLIDALKKLKRKYFRAMQRMGTIMSFVDPLNQIFFNLANKLWGTSSEDWKHMNREEAEK